MKRMRMRMRTRTALVIAWRRIGKLPSGRP